MVGMFFWRPRQLTVGLYSLSTPITQLTVTHPFYRTEEHYERKQYINTYGLGMKSLILAIIRAYDCLPFAIDIFTGNGEEFRMYSTATIENWGFNDLRVS